jgi:hypothetical protein
MILTQIPLDQTLLILQFTEFLTFLIPFIHYVSLDALNSDTCKGRFNQPTNQPTNQSTKLIKGEILLEGQDVVHCYTEPFLCTKHLSGICEDK